MRRFSDSLPDSHAVARMCRVLCVVLIILALGVARAADPVPPAATLNEILALRPVGHEPALRARDVIHSPVSIGFSVEIDPGEPAPNDPVPLVFCVPSDRKLTLRLTSYRLDGVERLNSIPSLADAARTTETMASGQHSYDPNPKPVTLTRLGIMRRWPLASVRLGPGFYAARSETPNAPAAGMRARLEITWDDPLTLRAAPSEETLWPDVGLRLVANPAGLNHFALKTIPIRDEIKPFEPWKRDQPGANNPWVKVRVAEPGLHRLAVEKLEGEAWREARANPRGLHLYHEGRELPLVFLPGADDLFFWNPKPAGPYEAENVLWATFLPSESPLRLPMWTPPAGASERRTLDHTRRSVLVDEDKERRISYGDFRAVRAMRWVSDMLEPGVPIRVPLRLDDPLEENLSASAVIAFYFKLSTMAHSPADTSGVNVTVRQEDGTTQSLTFSDDLHTTHSIPLNPGSVYEGMTTLTLQLDQPLPNRDLEELWLDWARVDYNARPVLRGGRLTLADDDPSTETWIARAPVLGEPLPDPAKLVAIAVDADGRATATIPLSVDADGLHAHWEHTPGRRVEICESGAVPAADRFEPPVADDPAREPGRVDMLIVTHQEFLNEVGTLAEFRRSQGLRVRVVDAQAVYDRFSFGGLNPHALRGFLAHTFNHWAGGPPETVLLVGDCTSDYLNYAKEKIRNWVPTFAHDVEWDRWASDEWMGHVAGNDVLSDVMIGRISAGNPADVKNIVEKIIAYDSDYPVGPWRARIGLVADNEPEFGRALDQFREKNAPAFLDARRIYADELPCEDNFYTSDEVRRETFDAERRWMKVSVEATARMLDLFRTGAAVITYFGHGSPNIWADERIWFGGDSPNSDNLYTAGSGRMPFIVNFTCNSGAIDYPLPQWNINIIEDMVRTQGGGAIGAFVPSGPGSTGVQEVLGNINFNVIYREGVRPLGEISTLTRLRFAATGWDPNYVYMYIMLGDPNTRLNMTGDVRRFDFAHMNYAAGSTLSGAVRLGPEFARAMYEFGLFDISGRPLWSAEPQAAEDGLAAFHIPLDQEWPTGPKSLRLYAWDEMKRRDMAAFGSFNIARSDDSLTTAHLWMIDSRTAQIQAGITNDSEIKSDKSLLAITQLSAEGPGEAMTGDVMSLRPGETRTLTNRIAIKPETLGIQVELHREGTPDDPSRDNPQRIRLAIPGRALPPPEPARLRIIGGVKIEPESPAEGRTIFARVTVENAGGQPSTERAVTLYESDPRAGGQAGYDHNQGTAPRNTIPPLGAGRRHEAVLRWDPTFNAGDRSFWVQLAPPDPAAAPSSDELTSATIHVRTKFKLSYRNVRADATAEDVKQNRMTLHAEVVNDGESEVRHVMIEFYRGGKTDKAHLIHEREIPILEANSSVPVEYLWNFGSSDQLADEDGIRGFRVQLRIKGSQLRITSPPPGAPNPQ